MRMNFSELRKRWRDRITGKGMDPSDENVKRRLDAICRDAESYLSSMELTGERTCLWNDIPDPPILYNRDSATLRSLSRMETMALAYCMEASPFRGRAELRDAIFNGLAFIHEKWYNYVDRKGGEWWHKEIGIPLVMNRICVLLYDEMSAPLRVKCMRSTHSYTSTPHKMCIDDQEDPETSTGANRVWKCLALAGCGIVTGDGGKCATAAYHIKDVFYYTTRSDGFYRDGSFVQHLKYSYNGGYGNSFVANIVDYMELLSGTPWNIGGKELSMLMEWIARSFEPFLFEGALMSMTRGREIARAASEEHVIGHQMIASLTKLAFSLPDEDALTIKRKIKAMIASDRYRDFFAFAPIPIIPLAREIMEDASITPYEFGPFCHIYAGMDRVVHRREKWALGISMNSERIGKYESIHNENVRGWYTSEGTTYLYNADGGQFSGGYFPTVNAYRMPGTTVDTAERAEEGYGFGLDPIMHTSLVGGTQMDHLYGAVTMEIENDCTDLRGTKSWFLFDDEIVCLGAGITATTGREIETVVENRKIEVGASLWVDVKELTGTDKTIVDGVRFAHLKCMDEDADIGYYFPEEHELELLVEDRTDSWRSISKNAGSDVPITNRFASIVIRHGIDPEHASYGYVVLPAKSAEETRRYADAPEVEILENSTSVQAVRHGALGIIGANFLTDEECRIDAITCHARASVMLREDEGKLKLSVSDPTWKNEGGITIELDHAASGVLSCDEGVEILSLAPKLKLSVNTKDAQGKTFSVTLVKE